MTNIIVSLIVLVVVIGIITMMAWYGFSEPKQPTIGGTVVPAVQCAEDEVITWLGPDTLGCVHYENVR